MEPNSKQHVTNSKEVTDEPTRNVRTICTKKKFGYCPGCHFAHVKENSDKGCNQCRKIKPWPAGDEYTKPSKSLFKVPQEQQEQLILGWNLIEMLGVTETIDSDLKFNEKDFALLRNRIIHLPDNGCLSICDAIDYLVTNSKQESPSIAIEVFTQIISWDLKTLQHKVDVTDEHLPYLFFIHVLGTCREILSSRFKESTSARPSENGQQSNLRAPKERSNIENGQVFVLHKKFVSRKTHALTQELEEKKNGLLVSTIAEKLRTNMHLDLARLQARNQFRNCALYEILCTKCEGPILDKDEQEAFKSYANLNSIDELPEKLRATLKRCRAQHVFDDKAIENVVKTIGELTNLPLDNLLEVLYTLNSECLKQRKDKPCKEKADRMKQILAAVPEFLDLPTIMGLKAKDFKDFDAIFDRLMNQLKAAHPRQSL